MRFGFRFQVQHQPHDARLEAPHPRALDVRVSVADFAGNLVQRAADLNFFQVYDQALRMLQGKQVVADRLCGFQRQAGVLLRRPDARGADGDSRLHMGQPEQAQQGG
ncbi:MAG: hypothetical protein FD134_969 [Gallionellaceae bacterium]|nr:MAG: hypothetical protein FD134_969 [Gallionellaceae bacterium]